MEVSYFPEGGSITDYTCKMFNTDLGVSVTRAMKFNGHYTKEDAKKLLTKKLKGNIVIYYHLSSSSIIVNKDYVKLDYNIV